MTFLSFLAGIFSGILLLWVIAEGFLWWLTPRKPSRLPVEPSGADAKLTIKDNATAVLNAESLTRRRQVIHSSSPKERDQ